MFPFTSVPPAPPLQTDLTLAYRVLNPEQAGRVTHLVLLLHGVGANERALLPVGQQLAGSALVLAVRAPVSLGPDAFGFYRVSFAAGRPVYDPAEEQHSRQLLVEFIEQASQRYGVSARQVYLFGFSQGAILAYSVGLTHPESIGGVLAFSGRMLDEAREQVVPLKRLRSVRFFVSHGAQDNTLPAAYAQQAVVFLREQGLAPHYEAFEGGHDIPASSLTAAKRWLYEPHLDRPNRPK